jgi:hypothetical protein
MDKMRDIIVLLPGILGSVLRKNDADVWGLSTGTIASAIWSRGGNIADLEIPTDQIDDDTYNDGVVASRLLPDAHLIPWFWKVDGYSLISQTLKTNFELIEGQNYFEFPYDWRLSNKIAASRLRESSHRWLEDWKKISGNNDAKLILIGHSMGGLVARYFLEVLEGWRDTRKLITFGTPYQGSINALANINTGLVKRIGPIELINLSDMLRSFPSVYQLLPTYRCCDLGDGNLLRLDDENVRIENLDPERVKSAFAFHQKIKDAVNENEKNEDYLKNRYQIHPFVGLYQPTSQSVRVSNQKIEILREISNQDIDGDGTVPSISATPYEWENQDLALFAAEKHASLQNFGSILVQLIRLLKNQNINFNAWKAVPSRIGLDIDDAFQTDEPILLQARSEAVMDLTAQIVNADSGELVRSGDLTKNLGEWQKGEFAPLPAGMYRIKVAEKDGMAEPVSDIFLVSTSKNA